MHPLMFDVQIVAHREDLESSGVCEDGFVPTEEPVESSSLCDHVFPGLEVEVIGVTEEHLRTEGEEIRVRYSPHCSSCCNGKKEGGFDCAVGGRKSSTAAEERFGKKVKHGEIVGEEYSFPTIALASFPLL